MRFKCCRSAPNISSPPKRTLPWAAALPANAGGYLSPGLAAYKENSVWTADPKRTLFRDVAWRSQTAGGERATLDDPERTKDWWTHLPRTAAWGDRYGGKFEQVRKLIDDAIGAKRRSRLNRRLTAALGVAAVLAVAGWMWIAHERAQEKLDTSAMKSAKSLLEDVLTAYNDKSLDLAGAQRG